MPDARQEVLDELRRRLARDSGDPDDTAALLHLALDEIHHLRIARDGRTLIGQATGILMERFDLAAEHAFGVLVRISQETNRKLHEIADELVADRRADRLPGTRRPDGPGALV